MEKFPLSDEKTTVTKLDRETGRWRDSSGQFTVGPLTVVAPRKPVKPHVVPPAKRVPTGSRHKQR